MRPDATHSYNDDLESFWHVMAWVSLTYMETNITPRARFDLLKTTFEDELGEDQLGRTLGGWAKVITLCYGRLYPTPIFNEPRVDALLEGLTVLFSCRYNSYPRDLLTVEERSKQLQDLETLDAFDHIFQTLLGEESSWKFPKEPKIQPVDPGRSAARLQETATRRNFRLMGHWPARTPITRAETAGIVPPTLYLL